MKKTILTIALLTSVAARADLSLAPSNAIAVTRTNAVISCGVSNTAASAVLWLYWGTNSGGTNATAWSNTNALGASSSSNRTVTLSNLTAATTYYWAGYATNGATSAWSSVTNFATLTVPAATYAAAMVNPTNGLLQKPTAALFRAANDIASETDRVGGTAALHRVAFSGLYSDLIGAPGTDGAAVTDIVNGIVGPAFLATSGRVDNATNLLRQWVQDQGYGTGAGIDGGTASQIVHNVTDTGFLGTSNWVTQSGFITNGQLGVNWFTAGNDIYFTGLGDDRTVCFTPSASPGMAAWTVGFTNISGVTWFQLKDEANNNERGLLMQGRYINLGAMQNGGGVEQQIELTVNGNLIVTNTVEVRGPQTNSGSLTVLDSALIRTNLSIGSTSQTNTILTLTTGAGGSNTINFLEDSVVYFRILHDASPSSPNNRLRIQSSSGAGGIDTTAVTITQGGAVGVRTTSPTAGYELDVNGSALVRTNFVQIYQYGSNVWFASTNRLPNIPSSTNGFRDDKTLWNSNGYLCVWSTP